MACSFIARALHRLPSASDRQLVDGAVLCVAGRWATSGNEGLYCLVSMALVAPQRSFLHFLANLAVVYQPAVAVRSMSVLSDSFWLSALAVAALIFWFEWAPLPRRFGTFGVGTSALATHATRDDALADAPTIWPVSWLELDIVTRQPLGGTDRFFAVGSVDIVGTDAVLFRR